MKVRVGTLCSGYDSQCLAMERLKRNFPDFDYELVFWSEFDPESKRPLDKQPAVIAHNALFPQWADRNVGDMTKVDWSAVGEIDLLTYSTPCTDISNAGRQAGAEKDSGTRSSIIWHTEKAIRTLRPKYLLMENVANFVSKAHIGTFKAWMALVESLGYNNFAKVLNATEFGCPQNRERIFVVSIRKDISDKFYFPQPIKLEKRFKDVLESDVDEKYYLSNALISSLSRDNKGFKAMKPSTPPHTGVASCLTARMHKMGRSDNYIMETNIPICLNSKVDGKQPSVQDRIYSIEGCAVAITSGWLQNIAEPQVMQVGNIVDDTNIGFKNPQRGRIYSADGLSPALNCCKGGGLEPKIVEGEITSNNLLELVQAGLVRIRKITPREAFRLMDIEEEYIDVLMSCGVANTGMYQLAGNSIVVGCLYHIFRKMFCETENENDQLTLF